MQKTDCRNEIYTKNWVRRTWPGEKVNWTVNGQSQRSTFDQQLVNGQRSTLVNSQWSPVNGQRLEMTSADQWMLTQLGLMWQHVEG